MGKEWRTPNHALPIFAKQAVERGPWKERQRLTVITRRPAPEDWYPADAWHAGWNGYEKPGRVALPKPVITTIAGSHAAVFAIVTNIQEIPIRETPSIEAILNPLPYKSR